MFAILHDDELWLKADADSDAAWDAAGAARFAFVMKDGRTGSMNYRRTPSDVYDDPEELQRWARLGLEAGLRGAAKGRKRGS